MNLFDPKTYSTDWEIMVFDRKERAVSTDKLFGFAGALRHELDLPIQIDMNTVECAMGVNHSFAQIGERITKVTDRLTSMLAEYDLDPVPLGSHPRETMYNAAHVHVGTLRDETAALYLEADLIPYTAVFAALAANSPVCPPGRRGEYKSYRVRNQAHGCTRPSSIRTPETAQPNWGMDAGPKLHGVATFEVRVLDCASSRRFLAELATFVAAYVHYRGGRVTKEPTTGDSYERSMVNRWYAAKYGLQATLLWDNGPKPVVEILDRMLDECADSLAQLGCTRRDLVLINRMIEKRTNQADYILDLANRYAEPFALASAMIKTLRHWDAFDNFLDRAPTLEPAPAPSRESVRNEHLALIGEGTHFYRSREAMNLPPPVADRIIDDLVREGRVKLEQTREGGTLLTKVSA